MSFPSHLLLLAGLFSESKPEACSIADFVASLTTCLDNEASASSHPRIRGAAYWRLRYETLELEVTRLKSNVSKGRRKRGSAARSNGIKKQQILATSQITVKASGIGGAKEDLWDRCLYSWYDLEKADANPRTAPRTIFEKFHTLTQAIRGVLSALMNSAFQTVVEDRLLQQLGDIIRCYAQSTSCLAKIGENHALLSHAVYDTISVCGALLTAIDASAAAMMQQNRNISGPSEASSPGVCTTSLLSGCDPPRAFASMLACILVSLNEDHMGHYEIFEGVAFKLLRLVGQRLDIPFWASDDSQPGQADTEETRTKGAQTTFLLWLLEQTVKTASRFSTFACSENPNLNATTTTFRNAKYGLTDIAWQKLQNTMLQAVFTNGASDNKIPMLVERAPSSALDESIESVRDCGPNTNFRREVWRILGWEILSMSPAQVRPHDEL